MQFNMDKKKAWELCSWAFFRIIVRDLCSAIEVHKHRRRLAGFSCDVPGSQGSLALTDGFQKEIAGSKYMIDSWHKQRLLPFLVFHFFAMRGDRIIVGEVRGGEAMDMLQSLNTGHDGSLSTLHANSSRDMLSRIETMTLMGIDLPLEAIRRQIASGVDILVHLGRMRDRSRKLLEVTEVCGFQNGEIQTRPLYRWEEGKGLVKAGELLHREKMERAGIRL